MSARSSTNLLGVAIVVLALAGSGGIAYAWSQGGDGGGCGWTPGDSHGGGCPPSFEIIWTTPISETPSVAYVGCTISISTTTLLTIGASKLAPGTNCKFSATLMNTGKTSATLDDTIDLDFGSRSCTLFQYSDNIYGVHPGPIIPAGGTFGYTSTVSLSSSAGNPCEGAQATIEVTITGTESVAPLTAPVISVSPTTIDSGQSSTLFTTTSFSGGMSPYTCQWLVEAPGHVSYSDLGSAFACSVGDLPTTSTGTLTTGTWSFELQVTDSSPATVTSNSVSVIVQPKPVTTYSVTFSESGLPCGLTWKVTVDGVAKSLTTNGGTDSLTWTGLTSGTYPYSIAGNSGWHQTTLPYNGNVVVSSASVTEPTLLYTQATYTVTFTETGLPSGTSWSVTLNGVTESSKTPTIAFSEPNGTYSYTVGTVLGCGRSPSSGSVTVNGAAVSVSVTFTKT